MGNFLSDMAYNNIIIKQIRERKEEQIPIQ